MAKQRQERYRAMLERLRKARLEARLTQKEVSDLMGMQQQMISKIELGERRIDPIELHDLARIYGKRLSDFLTNEVSTRQEG